MLIACLAALVCILEKWGVPEGIYFSFVTSLTIGYGDVAPNRPVVRNLSVVMVVVLPFTTLVLSGGH